MRVYDRLNKRNIYAHIWTAKQQNYKKIYASTVASYLLLLFLYISFIYKKKKIFSSLKFTYCCILNNTLFATHTHNHNHILWIQSNSNRKYEENKRKIIPILQWVMIFAFPFNFNCNCLFGCPVNEWTNPLFVHWSHKKKLPKTIFAFKYPLEQTIQKKKRFWYQASERRKRREKEKERRKYYKLYVIADIAINNNKNKFPVILNFVSEL